ncbi:MAG: hypothetical protein D8M58_09000 [Calditrichaeota bacterium]|nr:MAG: hypothetical protein DWQ03_17490 [Calditrichota bacterium]MBL1205522.1 hypothetical protein [Calditrichota bacterium]NOG45350.1 hypothetical protein [Calditrichota bacterium]
MDKTIETIWKEGFLKNDALVAPKLNDLYNQKSQLIIEKLKGMFKVNLKAIVIGAAVIFVGTIFWGIPYVGAFMFLALIGLVVYSKKVGDKIEEIDSGLSSYQYLIAFKAWRKEAMAGYLKVYRFFYPAIVMATFTGLWLKGGEPLSTLIIREFPDVFLLFGIPVYLIVGAVVLAGLSSLFAGPLYRWDLNIIYGRVFKKLDEIIADMEELRK